MSEQLFPIMTMIVAFGAVAAVVYVMGQFVATEVRVQKRAVVRQREPESTALFTGVSALVATYFDEKRFGLEDSYKANLRRELLRAGFFHVQNVKYYLFTRVASALLIPSVACLFALIGMEEVDWPLKLALVGVAFLVGNMGPSALLARRQRLLMQRYRILFPDLLDLMVVCVDAGLSLEAALERISMEMLKQSRELGMNLVLLGAEMRERRLMRAEERANQLPVKMVIPLGLFIFPVILLVIMFPVIVQLMTVFRGVN